MDIDIPFFKLVDRPLLPVAGSWVDAAPVVAMFFLLLASAYGALRLRGRARQIARRTVQLIAAFVFIIFLHRCLCMLRGWAFAMNLVGRNNILAFGHVCMFIVIFSIGTSFGRFFCGWVCPVHLLQEAIGKVTARRRTLSHPTTRKWAGYFMLAGVCVLVFWFAYQVRPGVRFFAENVAAVWGMALLLMLFFVLAKDRWDASFKRVKYYSMGAWLALSMAGVFVTSSWCVLFGDEVDYSSMVALIAVLGAGLVISMAWCRYLCPAGATLAVASKLAHYRVSDPKACTRCGKCASVCPMGALEVGRIDRSSCTYCGLCLEHCGAQWENRLLESRAGGSGKEEQHA
jgi:polyferredoxin